MRMGGKWRWYRIGFGISNVESSGSAAIVVSNRTSELFIQATRMLP
jgi:hypothetical protein